MNSGPSPASVGAITTPIPPDASALDGLRALRFAAIDFETATEKRDSACAIAIAIVEGGRVVRTERWLIRPPGNEYSPYNTAIHGITPKDTARARELPAVWAEASAIIEDRPLVAHYASFDMSVLRQSLSVHGEPWPRLVVLCSLMLSRRIWPGLMSYSLSPLARFLNVPLECHHDPRHDATACAEIVRCLSAAVAQDDFQGLADHAGLVAGSLDIETWSPCRDIRAGTSIAQLRPTIEEIDPEHPLHGRRVAFTGTLQSMTRTGAAQLVVNGGGRAVTTVSKFTDYLVFGEQDFTKFVDGEMSSKTRRARDLLLAGHQIEIVSEQDFLRMVDG